MSDALREAVAIMARLRGPDGCPWDREQTFDSIRRHTLEETYEVFDAIERRSWGELKDELGDLLLQVLFYAQMASDAGLFTIDDVAAGLNAKLIRRHPHVFGTAEAKTAEDVISTWESVKAQERIQERAGEPPPGALGKVLRHLPAMVEAEKLGKAAAKVGFDWDEVSGVLDKVVEEAEELRAELGAAEQARVQDELGDLLFSVVHLARHLRVEPEFALRGANAKFRRRFEAMEAAVGGAEALRGMSAEELDRAWRQAKITDRA